MADSVPKPLGVAARDAAAAPLLRRLARLAVLSSQDIERVRDLAATRTRSRAGTTLFLDGRAAPPQILLQGWASRQRVLRDGRRQIFDLVLAGESIAGGPAAATQTRQCVVALTPVETVDAGDFLELARQTPSEGLGRAIRAAEREEEARRLDHMVRLGRLTAYERVAHFVLEMQARSGAEAATFPLPLTQEIISDALGMSVVHLNRVLRQMRAENILHLRGGMASVRDARTLAAAAILSLPAGG